MARPTSTRERPPAPATGPRGSGPERPLLRGILHLVGAALLAASAAVLLPAAGDGTLRAGVAVYVAGVTAMLATSACYHVPAWSPAAARVLRRADHSAIFLGVAGTYTPVVLATLPSAWGTALLALVWVGAIAGIVVRNVFHGAGPWARATPYVALGWVGVLALPGLWQHSVAVTLLVLGGGVAYTLGAVVYARHRPDPWPATFGYHEVFHALTLVAVAMHWEAVRQAVSA